MRFVLLIVLYQSDPAVPPDSISKTFPTLQACHDAGDQAETLLKASKTDYGAVRMSCEASSDPRTEKQATKGE